MAYRINLLSIIHAIYNVLELPVQAPVFLQRLKGDASYSDVHFPALSLGSRGIPDKSIWRAWSPQKAHPCSNDIPGSLECFQILFLYMEDGCIQVAVCINEKQIPCVMRAEGSESCI